MTREIGCDDDAVARRVALIVDRRCAAADRDPVLARIDVHPAAVVLDLARVRRIQFLDVDILRVCLERLRAPGDAVVVSFSDAGMPRRRGTDHVPARRVELDEVAQRRMIECARDVGRGRTDADRPFGDRRRQSEEERRRADAADRVGDQVRHGRRFDPRRDLDCAIAHQQEPRPRGADRRRQPRAEDLVERVLARGERVATIQQVLRRPRFRLPSREQELLGGPLARDRDPGVHAAHERGHDRLRIRSVAQPLGVGIAAVLHAPRHRVALDEVRTEHLGQAALRGSPPEIHLKQPILGLHESLREKEIVPARREDVRHAPRVAHDAHRSGETGERERAGHLRHEWRGPRRRRAATCGADAERRENAQHHQPPRH